MDVVLEQRRRLNPLYICFLKNDYTELIKIDKYETSIKDRESERVGWRQTNEKQKRKLTRMERGGYKV